MNHTRVTSLLATLRTPRCPPARKVTANYDLVTRCYRPVVNNNLLTCTLSPLHQTCKYGVAITSCHALILALIVLESSPPLRPGTIRVSNHIDARQATELSFVQKLVP